MTVLLSQCGWPLDIAWQSPVHLFDGEELCWVFLAILGLSLVSAQQLSCSSTCGILVLQPGIKPVSPALEGSFLSTGPRGKSLPVHFLSHFPWRLFWVFFTLFKLQTYPCLSSKLASWFTEKLPTPWHHKPHPWLHESSPIPAVLSSVFDFSSLHWPCPLSL